MAVINMDNQFRRFESIVQAAHQCSVSVFGDFCVDAYWELSAGEQERSIETGLALNRVRAQRYLLGGAGSVIANLAAMKVRVIRAIGVMGRDPFGDTLHSMLSETGADTARLLVQQNWQTMVYAKPFDNGREHNRIDFGSFNTLDQASQGQLIAWLDDAAAISDAIVLNQQVPGGICSPELILEINSVIARHPQKLFIVDSRHRPELFRNVVLKLNMAEAARVLNEIPPKK